MALAYSLKYKKYNFYNKLLLEKDGEIVIDRQTFKLKGKGASDIGENIYFSDVKELFVKEDGISFTTFKKEKFILNGFSNMFESFIKDFQRVRNEFLADSLFMKVGMMMKEFDCAAEIVNNFEKQTNKGKCKIQIYEGSIIVIPEVKECFVIYLDFLKSHEFDEDEYVLRLFLDNGATINISKLGAYFEDCKELIETLMGKMYEKLVNYLQELFPGFSAETLLKLAFKIRGGKAVRLSEVKKIHDTMPTKLLELALKDNPSQDDKIKLIRSFCGDDNFYLGFSFSMSADKRDVLTKAWFLAAMPDKNTIAIGMTSNPKENAVHFFRIIMQQGDAKEKTQSKILEINQSMVIFKYDIAPLIKDRRELLKSKYKTAVKRLSFLRLIRKSYICSLNFIDLQKFLNDLEITYKKALILQPLIPKEKSGNNGESFEMLSSNSDAVFEDNISN